MRELKLFCVKLYKKEIFFFITKTLHKFLSTTFLFLSLYTDIKKHYTHIHTPNNNKCIYI
jgi:hypothetical protein